MSLFTSFSKFAAATPVVAALSLASLIPTDANADGAAAPANCCAAERQLPPTLAGVNHIVLIGIDGFGSYAWEKANIPNLKSLAAEGALTLNGRTILPTISAPNWGTHLMGAGPELHGWTSNHSQSPKPLVVNERGFFPGIFPLLRTAFPEAKLAAFYDWSRIHDLVDAAVLSKEVYVGYLNGKVTRFKFPKENPKATSAENPEGKKKYTPEQIVAAYEAASEEVVAAAVEYLEKEKPLLSFVYLGALDETGHKIGHDTPEYYSTLTKMDAGVGKIREALKKGGIDNKTLFIVVSDHGGVGKNHGGKSQLEVEVPWLISGPGIKRGVTLKSAIINTDTSPTIARVLGLPLPQPWRGKPVEEAIEK